MSLQVFLQARMLGGEGFLSSQNPADADPEGTLVGRCAWLTLIGEVLPRALLRTLKLSRMLLGTSSAEQFLVVLAEEDIPQANEFLQRAAKEIAELSAQTLRLVWATTENLGTWPVARKRLDDALEAKLSAPLSDGRENLATLFAPFTPDGKVEQGDYFSSLAGGLASAREVGWSSEHPAQISWDSGEFTWPLLEQTSDEEGILFPRRIAMDENGAARASFAELAGRSKGTGRWGVLRGDVDHFEIQLRRAGSIEEHIQMSALFKDFFAGEIALLCTLPDFWRTVTFLYRGGDDFAVAGSWDALIALGRELQRLFEKFVEQHLASAPGVEAKSISMALKIAPVSDAPAAEVFGEAGALLRAAKSAELGAFQLFGRTLEWKRLAEAEETKSGLVRLVRDWGYSPEYLNDVAGVYREVFSLRAGRRRSAGRPEKPWRTYMRLSRVIPQVRGKEVNNLRNAVISNLLGKRTAEYKLRPSARVGLEWARLEAES
jgi:CRISPR-associated protein Csm1